MNARLSASCIAACALFTAQARAEVTVTDAWTRATVAGQSAAGVFMKLRSSESVSLVNAASPAANIVEVHEMRMSGNVMVMRSIDDVPLPAGKTVELGPGGHHVMLIELVKPLRKGASVPVTLTFVDRQGKRSTAEFRAEVRAADAAPPKP